MKQHARRVAAKLSALKRLEMRSANLAIGTASAFVLATAAASLAVDRDVDRAPASVVWNLRGSIAPADLPLARAARAAHKIRLPVRTLVARLS